MLYFLKRHWFPVEAEFEFTLALTFALPVQELRPLLYPGLEVDEYDGFGFVAIAMVQTRRLRPAGTPRFFGQDFFLTGYRIFVRHQTADHRRLRGLQVLRSDTDSPVMVRLGNLLTHYRYEQASVSACHSKDTLSVEVSTLSRLGNLRVIAKLDQQGLPDGSPFPDERTARRFAGPMPFTFSYEPETGSLVRVEGVRSNWHPKLVKTELRDAQFLNQFPTTPTLASAFFVSRVPYRWERGVVARIPSDTVRSSRFSGVANIVRFNWPQFAAAGSFAAATMAISRNPNIPAPVRRFSKVAGTASIIQTLISLAVSHHVYDCSGLTRWRWLARKLPLTTKRILNIHSGFDETTLTLRKHLPYVEVQSVDLFDPRRMTEPSIHRARRHLPPPAGTIQGSVNQLPAEDDSVCAVLLLFSAHEFRFSSERQMLFQEAARVLRSDGILFLVEHLRDLPNLLAFGPGFFHFHSARTWLRDSRVAFRLKDTGAITPFVRWFELIPRK